MNDQWFDEPGFSVKVEESLAICKEALTWKDDPTRFSVVWNLLKEIEALPMSRSQQARLLILQAQVMYHLGDVHEALVRAPAAIDLANGADDLRLQGEAYRRFGELQRRRADFTGAATSYGNSIGRLWQVAEMTGWVDTAALRDSLLRCVGLELHVDLEEQALIHLDMALRVRQQTRLIGGDGPEVATEQWMRALALERRGVRGEMEAGDQALRLEAAATLEMAATEAMQAADAYSATGPENSAARIAFATVEILLHLVESQVLGRTARANYTRMAYSYLDLLETHATRGEDTVGQAMGVLARARLYRLDRPGYRMAVMSIRRTMALRMREHDWDWATISQARVALGRELMAQAERLVAEGGHKRRELARAKRAEARREFGQALALAGAHGSPGVAWFVPLALRKLDEADA